MMAIGFAIDKPALRTLAAFALTAGLSLQSILVLLVLRTIPSRLAKGFLILSSLSILVAMCLAVAFTLGDLAGEVWISIPQMARTHGVLNAFGYSLCGVIGWILVQRAHDRAQRKTLPARRPQTLLNRWE